ncbi:hypothetical protein KQX54_017288 [Cotesia glomerata]|uniref:Uncharacterized protein n=1 Tax=Cotesia glomerata TaxID=32391 RepID=A0AAV7IZL1_COTGL|nr:hypothetical protein KQX54_017288 [Cotesia glomerata]
MGQSYEFVKATRIYASSRLESRVTTRDQIWRDMSGPHSSTLAPVFSLPPPLGPGVFPSPPVVQGNSLGLMEGGREFPGVLRWVLGGLSYA